MFLAIKINLPKWKKKQDILQEEISADAVTADLRTNSNKLSFWKFNDQCEIEQGIRDVALAVIAAGNHVEKIEIVWLYASALCNDGHILKPTLGRTAATELAQLHMDVCGLDYVRLGSLAQHINEAIIGERHRRFTKKQAKCLLKEACEKGRVTVGELAPDIQKVLDPE